MGKEKLSKNSNLNINANEINLISSQSQKTSENISQNSYRFLKLENIRIISKQAAQREHHYRVNYLDKWLKAGFFFLDSYFRDKKELIQPNLVGNFLLMRGYKYQFFAGFG